MNIFVGNLSREATEEEVQQKFESFGSVHSVKIIRDMFTRESKGFGFVEMSVKSEGMAAINALNTADLRGKPMTVNEARPHEERPRRGGFRR